MCDSCKSEMEIDRCIQCGKPLEETSNNNPNFDENKFNMLKNQK